MATLSKKSGSKQPRRKKTGRSEPQQPVPELTEAVVRQALKSLPEGCDPERLEFLLERLLNWAKYRLPTLRRVSNVVLSGSPRRQAMTCLESLIKARTRLAELDPEVRCALIRGLASPPLYPDTLWWASDHALSSGQAPFDQGIASLERFISAMSNISTQDGPGHPSNLMPMLVIEELAEYFKFVTRMEATRAIDRSGGGDEPYETGPFYEFLAALWPPLFGNGDAGLSSALKNWAMWRLQRRQTR